MSCQGEYHPTIVKVGIPNNVIVNAVGVGGGLVDADDDHLAFLLESEVLVDALGVLPNHQKWRDVADGYVCSHCLPCSEGRGGMTRLADIGLAGRQQRGTKAKRQRHHDPSQRTGADSRATLSLSFWVALSLMCLDAHSCPAAL